MSEMVTTIVQLLDRCKNEAGGLTYGGFKESNDHIKFNVSDQSVRFLKAVFNAYCDLFKYGEAFIGGDVEAMKQYIQERLSRSISLSDKPTLKNFYFDILKKEEAKLETIITALSPFGNYHFPTKVEDLKELWLLDIYYNQELVELLNFHFEGDEKNIFLSIEMDAFFTSDKMNQVYQLYASEEKILHLQEQLNLLDLQQREEVTQNVLPKRDKTTHLSRTDEAYFCRLVFESEAIVKYEPNKKEYCKRVCKEFNIIYADRIGNIFCEIQGSRWPQKSIEKIKTVLLPNIGEDDPMLKKLNNFLAVITEAGSFKR